MLPILSIGPLSLPASPLILLLGIWAGTWLMSRRVNSLGRSPEMLDQILWTSLAAGLIGARLSFIIRNPWAFKGQVLSIFSLNPALLDLLGGTLIALAAVLYLVSKNQLDIRRTLDDFVPFLAVLAPALYLAAFASGDGFGSITDLPWGVNLWGAARHPVQLYYLIGGLAVLALVLTNALRRFQIPGSLFALFLILTTGYLTVLSSFQEPANQLILRLRPFQLGCWAVFTLAVIFYPAPKQDTSDE